MMVKEHTNTKTGNPLPPHMGYPFQLAARILLYTPSHRQDNVYDRFYYTLAGMKNGSVGQTCG